MDESSIRYMLNIYESSIYDLEFILKTVAAE